MGEYRRPFHAAFHLAWFVVDADERIAAGPFGSIADAVEYIERNGDGVVPADEAEAEWIEASSHPSYWRFRGREYRHVLTEHGDEFIPVSGGDE
jgi:hypothetical protein